jgi:ADP-ribose pyrophosphatase YjhB (NUDIX family)
MGRISEWFRRERRQPVRVIATALAERDDHLLLVQLARGPFAGFWLLPSATVEQGTVVDTVQALAPQRVGGTFHDPQLLSVVEEPRLQMLILRFVFAVAVEEPLQTPEDIEIARAVWFARTAVRDVLAERDVVPNLGVMSLLRSWVEGIALRPLELLTEDALCPCGSGYRFPGCCGWESARSPGRG